MFKMIKMRARAILLQNYKYFPLPTVLFMLSNAVSYLILNGFTSNFVWNDLHIVLRVLLPIIFLLCEFVGWPLAVALIFKITIVITAKKDENIKAVVKRFLTPKNILKITIINFIPRLFTVFFDVKNVAPFGLQIPEINNIVLLILLLVSMYITYRLFACNYCFALNEASVKETLLSSIKITKNTLGKYISWYLSFLPWGLLIAGVHTVLKSVICTGQITVAAYAAVSDISTPLLDVLAISFGYGSDFYIVPYMYVTLGLFIDGLLNNKQGQ